MKKLVLMVLFLTACGQNGTNGIDGSAGPAGANGSSVTVVRFCLGGPPVYPSTFPETGLCINNAIYAVYSANDGFLTELPPGLYTSDAIGSSCTFTVLPNCLISTAN